MTDEKMIDLTPKWTDAVRVYIACLLNPEADHVAHAAAETDLLNLARFADETAEARRIARAIAEAMGGKDDTLCENCRVQARNIVGLEQQIVSLRKAATPEERRIVEEEAYAAGMLDAAVGEG